MADRQFDTENFSLGAIEDNSATDFLGIRDTSIIGSQDLHNYLTDKAPIIDNTKQQDNNTSNNTNNNNSNVDTKAKELFDKEKEIALEREQAVNQFTDFLTKEESNNDNTNNTDLSTEQKDNKELDKDKDKSKDSFTGSKEKDNKDNKNADVDENTFDILSKNLFKLGVFNLDENEEAPSITSGEQFLERFNNEKKKGSYEIIDNFLNQFGDEYKQMFDAVYVNGVHPYDYIGGVKNIDSIKSLNPEDNEDAKQIFKSYYKNQGMPEEIIKKQLEKAIEFEYLKDSAKDLHTILLQQEESKEATKIEDKKKELAQKSRIEYEYQQSVGKILTEKIKVKEIDGIPLNDKEAKEVYSYLINKPYEYKGEKLSQFEADLISLDKPENHELKVKLALLLKNKLDLSKVKQKALSSKSETLFENLTLKDKNNNRNNSVNKVSSMWD